MAVVLLAGGQPARAQLPAAAGRRPRLRPARRAGGADLPRHGELRRRREEPRLLRDAGRAPGGAARRRLRRAERPRCRPARSGPDFDRPVWPEERPDDERARRPAWVRMVTPGYFRTLGMRGRRGPRLRRDGTRRRRAARGDPEPGPGARGSGRTEAPWVGGSSSTTAPPGPTPTTWSGVVNDVRFGGPRTEPRHEIYLPHAQRPYLVMNMAVRSAGDPRYLAPGRARRAARAGPRQAGAGPPRAGRPPGRHLLPRPPRHAGPVGVRGGGRAPRAARASTACCPTACASGPARSASAWRWAPTGPSVLRWMAGHGAEAGRSSGSSWGARWPRPRRGSSPACSSAWPRRDPGGRWWPSPALPLVALLVSLHPAWRATRDRRGRGAARGLGTRRSRLPRRCTLLPASRP